MKGIYFDFGGTLDSDGVAWKERLYPVFEDFGLTVPKEKFERAFYDSDDSIVAEKLYDMPFKETIQLQIGGIFCGLKIDNSDLERKIVDRFWQDSLEKLKENQKTLEHLKKNYILGIISNFYGNLPAIIKEIGLSELFNVIIDSNRVGYLKPDPKIFYMALKTTNLSPSQVVFVGDSLNRDMAGAKGIGMPHIWLGGEKVNGYSPCCPGDKAIKQLSDLLLINKWI